MAVRTSVALVKQIIETDLGSSIIGGYISSANVFVTQTLSSSGLSDTVLADIEKWIAAHMLAMTRERQYKRAGAGGAEVEYFGKFGEGLSSTPYGQMAVELDTSGTLAEISGKKLQASIRAVPNFDD